MRSRIRTWWLRRRLVGAVLAQLGEGTGVTSAEWPAGTARDTVLAWLDGQLAAERTPYDISGAKVLLFRIHPGRSGSRSSVGPGH